MPKRNVNIICRSILRFIAIVSCTRKVVSFAPVPFRSFGAILQTRPKPITQLAAYSDSPQKIVTQNLSFWEAAAQRFVSDDYASNHAELRKYVQILTVIRVGIPSLAAGFVASVVYPDLSMNIASLINSKEALDVIANDYSQYVQNILTTCGLMFTIMTGYTYYFLYKQQEAIFNALFHEVSVASSLLEQVSLVCQGREDMYHNVLESMERYIKEDLIQFTTEPSVLLSARPVDDPLEDIFYLTSVGEPSVIYQTVRSLRHARAMRLGNLQKKLPPIQMTLLWSLAAIVLSTFPLLGAGSQTIGGPGILHVQSIYMSFIVFGVTMVMGIIKELSEPAGRGAYNVVVVLAVLVENLEEEVTGRMAGKFGSGMRNPSADGIPFLAPFDNEFSEVEMDWSERETQMLHDGE